MKKNPIFLILLLLFATSCSLNSFEEEVNHENLEESTFLKKRDVEPNPPYFTISGCDQKFRIDINPFYGSTSSGPPLYFLVIDPVTNSTVWDGFVSLGGYTGNIPGIQACKLYHIKRAGTSTIYYGRADGCNGVWNC